MPVSLAPARGTQAIFHAPETPAFQAPEPTLAPEEESLKSVWRVIRKRRYWILSVMLAGLVLALVACLLLKNQYEGTSTVQVGKDQTVEVSLGSNAGSPTLSQSDTQTDIATHMAVLEDDNTALAVINDLHLQNYPPFAFKPSIMGWLKGSDARIRDEMAKGLPLSQATETRQRLLTIFEKKLTVKNIPDTRLITVSFLNVDPQLAANVSNTLVREYVKFESESQPESEATHLLDSQLADLKAKMDKAQNDLAVYEQQTGLNSLLLKSMGEGSGGGSVTHIPAIDQLDTLNQELTAAQANRIGKEAIYRLTSTHNADVVAGLAASSLPDIATSSVVSEGSGLSLLQNLRQQLSDLNVQYSAASARYGAKNPKILELQTQIAGVNKQISQELQQINLRAKNDYELARNNENGIRAAFNTQQGTAGKMNENAVKLEVLVQQAASTRQLYDSLSGQLQEATVQAGLRGTNIRVMDPARPPATPERPNPPLYLAIGLAVGLIFGVSSAFVREHMDDTVKTRLEVDPLTPLPVLASIPLTQKAALVGSSGSALQSGGTSETSLLITRPRSAGAEAYRGLRTSIVQASAGFPLQTMLVTSSLVGEGKTTVSYNIAVAFANAGERVLLLDADLHHPRLHALFGGSRSPGLTDVLNGEQIIDAAVQVHPTIRNLSLLPAGAVSPTPAELLGSAKFDELIGGLKQTYSLIVLDSPPMLLVSDAIVLSGKVDATLAVIRAEVTNLTVVGRMTSILERTGSHAVGLVLNGVDTNSIDYYHAYGHNGGDKYYEEY
jgi:succinoglycan biosynthesis transport protein ExoP